MRDDRIPAFLASQGTTPARTLELIIRGLLYLYIFSLPFQRLLVLERNIFLALLVLLPLWCLVSRRHFFLATSIDLPLMMFVAWVGFTLLFAVYPDYSRKEFGKLLQQVVIFYAVVYFLRARPARVSLLYLLLGSAVVVSVYGISQFDLHDGQATKSFFPSEVWLTTYLVLMGPFFMAFAYLQRPGWLRWGFAWASLLSAMCLLMTRSRAGLLSLFIELWVMAWLLKRRSAFAIAGGVTAMILVVALLLLKVDTDPQGHAHLTLHDGSPVRTDVDSVVHRFDIWAFSVAKIQEHWLVGIGYGKDNYKLVYGNESEEVLPGHHSVKEAGVHNLFLALALHVGLPGMMLYLWLMGRLIRRLTRELSKAEDVTARAILLGTMVGVIGLGVRLMFDQMLVGTLAVQFWVVIAIAVLHFHSHRQVDIGDELPARPWPQPLAGTRPTSA